MLKMQYYVIIRDTYKNVLFSFVIEKLLNALYLYERANNTYDASYKYTYIHISIQGQSEQL